MGEIFVSRCKGGTSARGLRCRQNTGRWRLEAARTDLDPLELGEAASLFPTRPRLADHMADAASVQGWADAVFAGILEGALSIEIVGRCPLEAVNPVQAAIEGRTPIGKAIVCL